MKLGTNDIGSVYLGSNAVSSVYLGTNLVWSGMDADYKAILDYATTQGYTLPSASQQLLQEQLVKDLKTAGIWSKLDTFAVFATDGDTNFALIDWKRLTQMTSVNSPTFTTNEGFTGNGTSAYINTNFNPSLASLMSANNSNMTIRMNTTIDTATLASFAGCFDSVTEFALQIVEFRSTNQIANDNFGDNRSVPRVALNQFNWFSTNRNSSTQQVFITNTNATFQGRNFVGIPNLNVALLARLSNAGIAIPSDRQVSMFAAGQSLISENTDFYNAFNNYLNAL